MLPVHLRTRNSKLETSYTGAQILISLLERQGIEIIPGIPGGGDLPMYDALYDSPVRHVLARHGQGAGFMAQGTARVTGNPAPCFGTSGPGATNLTTAIADARVDSIPLIAITGQVPRALIGTDAFQEVDTCGLTLPITRQNFPVCASTTGPLEKQRNSVPMPRSTTSITMLVNWEDQATSPVYGGGCAAGSGHAG
jgi:glyoxylate carboligase